jgi:hypothetical protein
MTGKHRQVRVLQIPVVVPALFVAVVFALSTTILSTAGSVIVYDRPSTLPTAPARVPSPTHQEAPK